MTAVSMGKLAKHDHEFLFDVRSTAPPPGWPGCDTAWGPDRMQAAGRGAACAAPTLQLSLRRGAGTLGGAPCTARPDG